MKTITILLWTALAARGATVVAGEIVERDGLARRGTWLEQGIPIPASSEEYVRRLRLRRADGQALPAFIEPEGRDENGKVRWVRVAARVSMPARGRLPVRIEEGEPAPLPPWTLREDAGAISVTTPHYELELRRPGGIFLRSEGKDLLGGNWSVVLHGDARAILWGSYFREFVPTGIEVEQRTAARATLLLKGHISKNQRKAPHTLEPGRRFDCELRLHLTPLSPHIRFSWRITNLIGHKTWLQRYALSLPLSEKASAEAVAADRILLHMKSGGRLAVTAGFAENLGPGAGVRLAENGHALLQGGLDMPPDGGYYSGRVPDIHRLFHQGMSRTFEGALISSGALADAAEELAPVDLVLPPQYYSDTRALPEHGDPVTFGEFAEPIRRSAEWLLQNQWRGTLFWGEWYREWDDTRNMGVQEASNGHSPLAPLYHYWRTGDARFLHCARRSFEYTRDVQLSKSEENQGRMFHTRRHLFDELDWIHPRYQRATGGLISSHVFLDAVARREIVETIRSFYNHIFDDNGVPHDWDKQQQRRRPEEDGVDTSNFMEALTMCYRETGDREFLDRALKMSRWTAARWEQRGKRRGDDWNWNLTNYVLRGLLTLHESSADARVRDLAVAVARATLSNTAPTIYELKDGVGGGELHFVFYHAWLSTRAAKLAPDGDGMIAALLEITRREVARQREDGAFVLDHGAEAGLPTRWISYYDCKALVAYVPVLTAHLAARRNSVRTAQAPARANAAGEIQFGLKLLH